MSHPVHRRSVVQRPRARRSIRRRLRSLVALPVAILGAGTLPMLGHAQSVSLRVLADDAGISFGAAVDAAELGDDAHRELLMQHVNLVSTRGDLSMATVQPEPGSFDFGAAEDIVDFAVDNGLSVRVHQLIGGEVPAWLSEASWTVEDLTEVLRDHVTTVVGHFRDRNPGVITQWDVVGGAFLPDGTLRPTIWQQVIGDGYLQVAYEAAHAADPDAVLFYDDFYDDLAVTQDAVASGVPIVPGANAERSTCDAVPKCVGVRDRIAGLVAAGTPIGGVGFQAHLFSPDPAAFPQFTTWVGELGLEWAVTEFDVPLPVTEITADESLAFQASVYADALATCVDAANCDTFVTWGITDRYSPIPDETGGAFGGALWFDADDVAKPAFDAMAQVLGDRGTPTTTTSSDPTIPAAPTTIEAEPGSDGDATVVPVVVGAGALVAIAVLILLARRRRRPVAE